jgi:hypothetical protein
LSHQVRLGGESGVDPLKSIDHLRIAPLVEPADDGGHQGGSLQLAAAFSGQRNSGIVPLAQLGHDPLVQVFAKPGHDAYGDVDLSIADRPPMSGSQVGKLPVGNVRPATEVGTFKCRTDSGGETGEGDGMAVCQFRSVVGVELSSAVLSYRLELVVAPRRGDAGDRDETDIHQAVDGVEDVSFLDTATRHHLLGVLERAATLKDRQAGENLAGLDVELVDRPVEHGGQRLMSRRL